MRKVSMKEGDLVQHIDYPNSLRGIVKEVTAYRSGGRPRKVRVLWFPIDPDAAWAARMIGTHKEPISVMKLDILSSASEK